MRLQLPKFGHENGDFAVNRICTRRPHRRINHEFYQSPRAGIVVGKPLGDFPNGNTQIFILHHLSVFGCVTRLSGAPQDVSVVIADSGGARIVYAYEGDRVAGARAQGLPDKRAEAEVDFLKRVARSNQRLEV